MKNRARSPKIKPHVRNPLRLDPTRTTLLRRQAIADVRRRFARLALALDELIVRQDSFGLRERRHTNPFATNAFCPTGEGGGVDPSCGRDDLTSVTSMTKAEFSDHAWFHGQDEDDEHFGKQEIHGGVTKSFVEAASYAGLVYGKTGGQVRVVPHSSLSDKQTKRIATTGPGHKIIDTLKDAPVKSMSLSVPITETNPHEYLVKKAIASGVKVPDRVLKDYPHLKNNVTRNERWELKTSPERLALFQAWLAKQLRWTVVGATRDQLWAKYVQEGFVKGAGRAFDDVRSKRGASFRSDDFLQGQRRQFLSSSFRRPETVEKVKLLASRTFEEMVNVGEEVKLKLGRVLTDGLTQGKNPRDIAREMRDRLAIPLRRAETIARTEIIRAHSEGQLNAMEDLGVDEVGVMVEWSTAGDDRVCEACLPMEGVVLKLEEAHNMIPRHPNCRCSFIPANVGESRKEQVRGKTKIEKQIDISARLAGDTFDVGIEIDAYRPRSTITPTKNVENAFCPTGEGGGQDNSCSPTGGGVRVPIEQMTGDVKESERLSLPIKDGIKKKNETCSVWGDCTNQAFKAWERGEGDVYYGWAIPKENLEQAYDYHEKTVKEFGPPKEYYQSVRGMFAHAWNVKDGQIIDHAMGSKNAKDYVYFGKPVAESILKSIKHGDDLVNIDYQTMKMTKNAFCPTGPGGGVDPTCGRGDAASAIHDYTEESDDVNIPLREGGVASLTGRSKEVFDRIQPLAQQSLPEPTTVYRGVQLPGHLEDSLVPGATIKFDGLTSTSTDLEEAKVFGRRGVMLKIKAKTGVVVGSDAAKYSAGQKEIIQAHGTSYKVVKEHEHDLKGHRRLIELEEI